MRAMILPRYSTRALLGLVSAAAVYALVISRALRGADWAIALSVALGALLLGLVLQSVVFLVVWALSQLNFGRRRGTPPSPSTVESAAPSS